MKKKHDALLRGARVNRQVVEVVHTFAEADRADRKFWASQTPESRLRALAHLRRITYGDAATARLQRVFEIVRGEAPHASARRRLRLSGVQVNLINLSDLLRKKKAAGRHKHLNDLEHLPG